MPTCLQAPPSLAAGGTAPVFTSKATSSVAPVFTSASTAPAAAPAKAPARAPVPVKAQPPAAHVCNKTTHALVATEQACKDRCDAKYAGKPYVLLVGGPPPGGTHPRS